MLCSQFWETPLLWKWHKLVDYRKENAASSVLASKAGSNNILGFAIVLSILRKPLREKTLQNKQIRARICWHILFGQQIRKWNHFEFHHFTIPRIPLPEKMARNNQQMAGKCSDFLFGPFWRLDVLPFFSSTLNKLSQTDGNQFCSDYNNLWHERGVNPIKWLMQSWK